jgi:hypothetical protein
LEVGLEDHVLVDHPETGLGVHVGHGCRRSVPRLQLDDRLFGPIRKHVLHARDDEPAKEVTPDVDGSWKSFGEQLGHRRLPGGHDARDENHSTGRNGHSLIRHRRIVAAGEITAARS